MQPFSSLRSRLACARVGGQIVETVRIHVVEKDDQGMVIDKQIDPNLQRDEATGDWSFTEPDWDEFYRVIRGNGPCNKQRIGLRRLSYEQGRWVRNAVLHGSRAVPPAA